MTQEISPKQRWLTRACLFIPLLTVSTFHIIRLMLVTDVRWLFMFFVSALVVSIGITFVERKYNYVIPTCSDLIIGLFSAGLLAASHAWIARITHPGNTVEMVDSVIGVFTILPFILLLKSKKQSAAIEPAS